MDKKNWKTLCMGTVVAISGIVGFTSCENKNEKQGENKPQKENYHLGQTVLQNVKYPTVKTASKQNEVDSILVGVEGDIVRDYAIGINKIDYKNPTYAAKGKSDPRKVNVDIQFDDNVVKETGKSTAKFEFTYDERTPEDSIREAKERIEAQKEFNRYWNVEKDAKDDGEWIIEQRQDTYSSTVQNDDNKWTATDPENISIEKNGNKFYHEKSKYDDGTVEVEFDYIDMPGLHNDNGKEQVSQKQQEPEKKEPPKGSISHDAFINALLERKGGRGGKK